MSTEARHRLAAVLGEASGPGSFSARRASPPDDLHIEVRGLGPLSLPVPAAQARQLCGLGRPARYGQGERTLLDRGVRDTWEIPKSRVKIDKRRWDKTLLAVLERLRGDLGIPAGCTLEAEFHSMLVYAPGQFFVPHQDSEKSDAMVGSLVVTLPGAFKGGALVVGRGGEAATYRGSKNALSFVAFYADCRHEIRPVRSGYRVVLTYDLALRGEPEASQAPPGVADALAACLADHFSTPLPPPRWPAGAGAGPPPDRLVYLLDHEYTARALSWARLKGTDARRAGLLREAAALADCDIVLGLADVHETWSASDPAWDGPWYGRPRYGGRGGPRYGRWGDDDDEDEDDDIAEAEEYELDELIDWDITVDRWLEPSGEGAEPVATDVADHEVCTSTPSADLRPYASEYEGYMGNYGNTMDRWYRRGALLVWPRRRAFVVRAEASPAWAVDALSARVRARDVEGAREMAATLAPFWEAVARRHTGPTLLTKTLRVARALDQPELAEMLLRPFRLVALGPRHAPALVAVVEGYGERWASDLLALWSGQGPGPSGLGGEDRAAWTATLARLCAALAARGEVGASTARLVVRQSWRWLREAVDQGRDRMPPKRRDEVLGELILPLLAVLEATVVLDTVDVREEVVGFLGDQPDDLLGWLLRVLRAAHGPGTAKLLATGLDAVATQCAERLEARLARPPRAADDWSIELPAGCGCPRCVVLGGFLADPERRTFEWPLAQEGRRHVHVRLDAAEAPVRHQTRRSGRPFTLVLTKTEALFERDKNERRRDEADLRWLRSARP